MIACVFVNVNVDRGSLRSRRGECEDLWIVELPSAAAASESSVTGSAAASGNCLGCVTEPLSFVAQPALSHTLRV